MNTEDIWDQLENAGFNRLELESFGFSFRGKTIYVKMEDGKHKITVAAVMRYYATDARNISSGCRELAGIVGDWRPINDLASICLAIYKVIKRDALTKEARSWGMVPRW